MSLHPLEMENHMFPGYTQQVAMFGVTIKKLVNVNMYTSKTLVVPMTTNGILDRPWVHHKHTKIPHVTSDPRYAENPISCNGRMSGRVMVSRGVVDANGCVANQLVHTMYTYKCINNNKTKRMGAIRYI